MGDNFSLLALSGGSDRLKEKKICSMLPKEAIEEFKELYRKHYGVDLSDEEASFRANNLMTLYKAVYGEPTEGRLKDAEVPQFPQSD